MPFGMFSANTSPIAIDFGTSTLKALQISSGDEPSMVAAGQLEIPDSARQSPETYITYLHRELPTLLSSGKFRGKRVVCAVPSAQSFIQHMQVGTVDGVSMEDLIKSQLQTQMGCHPDAIVVRSQHVRDCSRGQSAKSEVICFAVARDTVMRYIDLLKRCRLEVVGAHTEILAMVRAFDHINRRESDVNVTNLYVDIGWAGTRVAISHGRQPVFARYIPFGGRQFDQHIAGKLNCDVASARAHRISLQDSDVKVKRKGAGDASDAGGGMGLLSRVMPGNGSGTATKLVDKLTGTTQMEDRRHGEVPDVLSQSVTPIEAPSTVVNVDMGELLDTIADELSMCLRYHAGMFPDRKIDRAIFLGGETRLMWLCQHVVKELRLSGQLGDPLARLRIPDKLTTPGLDTGVPRPDWAVVCGLCQAPTDL